MKANAFCAAILLLICVLPARAAERLEQHYTVGASVDAQGHLTSTEFDANLPKPIVDLLTQVLRQWHFSPAKSGGKPVPAHTFIHAKVEAIPDDQGKFSLRVSYEGNGPKLITNNIPIYPADAIRQRQAGFLVLTFTVKADGSIADLKVLRQFDHWPVMPSFKRSILAAAKEWRAVPEQVDGQPMTTHIRKNFNFILTGDGAIYTDEQIRWLRQAAQKEAAVESLPGIPLPSDQFTALDSPLQPTSVATITSAP